MTIPVPAVPPPARRPTTVPEKPSAWNAATAEADAPAARLKSLVTPEFKVIAPALDTVEAGDGETLPVIPSMVVSRLPTVAVARSTKVVPATGAGAAPV